MTIAERHILADMLGVDSDAIPEDHRPHCNIAPTDRHFVITSQYESRRGLAARWGLANSWAKNSSRAAACINAQAETVETRGAFREASAQRRCVIPADGFYEWTGPKNARRALRFHRRDGGLLLFAGLYESWFRTKDSPEMTFTIITCAPNAAVAPTRPRLNQRETGDTTANRSPSAFSSPR